MKVSDDNHMLLLLLCCYFFIGSTVEASISYDYSASIECLDEPQTLQYEGGILTNPHFDNGLQGWGVHGEGKMEVRESPRGNWFMIAYDRRQPSDSFSQQIDLKKGHYYIFSALVQIDDGNETEIAAYIKSGNRTTNILGSVIAQSGCWSMLKGGLTVDLDSSAELYFESKNTSIDLWIDNVSLQSFTKDQWRDHQFLSIEKVRKRTVRFHVLDKQGKGVQGAKITITQTRPHFPLGCGLASTIINNKPYQDWFASRFTATTFHNEMKWHYTERIQGHENYSVADAMLAFTQQHEIAVRGHNIFWDNPKQNTHWVKSLSQEELANATLHRLKSVVSRYSGNVIAWDVNNENLHFSFFEKKLGPNASAMFFNNVQKLDSKAILFLNEFNTLEYEEDTLANPAKYLQKIKEIRDFAGNENMTVGIGLQGHFGKPNIPYVRACLDILGATNMPIWLTELDVQSSPDQAKYLEEIMREAYSHPSVQGIIVWSSWKPMGCSNMCLTDNNFKNLPTGVVVDKLIKEWKTETLNVETDDNGVYEDHIFQGVYSIRVSSSNTSRVSKQQQIEVSSENTATVNVQISV